MRIHTSLVLTGIIEHPYRQYYIGSITIYLDPKTDKMRFTFTRNTPHSLKGSVEDSYEPIFELAQPSHYIIYFPDYESNTGLRIEACGQNQRFNYTTGFDPQLPSFTGTILNGNWLVDVLDEYFCEQD